MTISLFALNLATGLPNAFAEYVAQPSSTIYTSDGRGFITNIAAGDIGSLVRNGCVYAIPGVNFYQLPAAPAAASVAAYVASVALANGTLTLAAQPDVMRQVQIVVGAGTAAISAGVLALTYFASDGTSTVDPLPLATAASGTTTLMSSKGVMKLTTAIVTGLAGGASPYIFAGSNGNLALPLPLVSTSAVIGKETNTGSDVAVGSVSPGGVWTPHAAPNGTITFGAGFSWAGT